MIQAALSIVLAGFGFALILLIGTYLITPYKSLEEEIYRRNLERKLKRHKEKLNVNPWIDEDG